MFGIANQLLAAIALSVATTVMINAGRAKYAAVTLAPMAFVMTTTLTAAWQLVHDRFLPAFDKFPADRFKWGLNIFLTAVMVACLWIIVIDSVRRWRNPIPPNIPAPVRV
jgi:carbon starvation protein